MTASVVVTPEARRQLERIDDWWRSNRPQSPGLFAEELERMFELLADSPEVGRRYPYSGYAVIRRVLLRGSRNHVYYRFRRESQVVLIVAFWGAVRGEGPPLG